MQVLPRATAPPAVLGSSAREKTTVAGTETRAKMRRTGLLCANCKRGDLYTSCGGGCCFGIVSVVIHSFGCITDFFHHTLYMLYTRA